MSGDDGRLSTAMDGLVRYRYCNTGMAFYFFVGSKPNNAMEPWKCKWTNKWLIVACTIAYSMVLLFDYSRYGNLAIPTESCQGHTCSYTCTRVPSFVYLRMYSSPCCYCCCVATRTFYRHQCGSNFSIRSSLKASLF